MKKVITYILILLLAVALYFVYQFSTAITFFLSAVIVSAIIYFITNLNSEREIAQAELASPALNFEHARNKRHILITLPLLLLILFAALITEKKVMKPGNGYFKNTDYHGLNHYAISFKDRATFQYQTEDSGIAEITFRQKGTAYQIVTTDFDEPIFQKTGREKYRVVNAKPGYDVNNAIISNGINTLTFHHKKVSSSDDQFTVHISSNDREWLQTLGKKNCNGELTFHIKPIRYGISLNNLFSSIDNYSIQSDGDYEVLNEILSEAGSILLLASHSTDKEQQYIFFKTSSLGDYKLIANKTEQNNSGTFDMAAGEKFYIGFANNKSEMHLSPLQNEQALYFDYPNTYYLSTPNDAAEGTHCVRFITNQNNILKDLSLAEGFCFQHPNLSGGGVINGVVEYTTGNASQNLQVSYTDRNATTIQHKTASNNQFYLLNPQQNLKYQFRVRDFSDNGFSYNKTIAYTLFIFLLFAFFTVFSNAGSLRRFQPIALFVLFALIVIRFILYWRIATFPPLENISKHELENTFRSFDFNLLGLDIPVPATLVFTFGVIIAVMIYRKWQTYRPQRAALDFDLQRWFPARWNLSGMQQILIFYTVLLIICGVLSLAPVDFIKRLSTILIPTILYIVFSKWLNQQYVVRHLDKKYQQTFLDKIRAYLFYLIQNPTFNITLISILFFALADRGYCVLFILFILLKNVLLNFLKKSIGKTPILQMFTRPWNYWVYGLAALVLYFVFIVQKSLFYYLLTYKLIFIALLMMIVTLVIHLFDGAGKKIKLASLIILSAYLLCIAVPQSRSFISNKITQKIKHVQYRASIIHQPVSALLEQNDYSGFSARKIIETAENQWFINTYISNPFDYSKPVNFKSFTKVGVNYNTQTRDVVVARFIIGELGTVNMYLILIICILPLVFYLVSYKIKKQDNVFEAGTYAGLIPMLIFFTLCLFVWLTSTNRFVFFGQDYPFLSLTSKLSVLFPLMLFFILLIQKPALYNFLSVKTELAFSRYLILFGLIVLTSAFTVIKNELNKNNFNVVVHSTKNHIEQPFDNLLGMVQDSLENRHIKFNYEQLCKVIRNDQRYKTLVNKEIKEPYTRSILALWAQNPSTAMRVNNPLYIRYDQGRYRAEYNNTLYLTLPVADNRKVWHGTVSEYAEPNMINTLLTYGSEKENISLPYCSSDSKNNISLCILPVSWLSDQAQPRALLDVHNQYKSKTTVMLQKKDASVQIQSALNFSRAFDCGDVLTVQANHKKFDIVCQSDGIHFVTHKWVNNNYRPIFPMGVNNFWVYNLANALRTPFKNTPEKSMPITLDYHLHNDVQQQIRSAYKQNSKNKKFNFSVIAADGDGNIRILNEYNGMRTELDPNDPQKIYQLQQEHFFFSNTAKERKQWGNANLLNLHLGPGSSIKPVVMAAIGSQAHLEWDRLMYVKSNLAEENNYAGLPLSHAWKNIEHYGNAQISLPEYIEHSSNFFHSVILFLGSYTKADFTGSDQKLSLKKVLTTKPKRNTFPRLSLDGTGYYLPNYSDKKWPASDAAKKSKSYFANENSLIATGMSANLNVATTDIDKQDGSPMNTGRVLFCDSTTNVQLKQNNFTNSIWVLPEASSFSQKMRHYISSRHRNEINENFNLGLKTPTLGGYPYQITPLKMLEMYNALFTQNRNYHAGIAKQTTPYLPWQIDSSWSAASFNDFLCNNIFEGMRKVIVSGTATKLNALRTVFPDLFFYAKTGTINEESSGAASSRRLILTITDKDMTKPENINRSAKVYSIYFVIDNNRDFDWNLLIDITKNCIDSRTFKNYFGRL